jgi:threonine synthase
MFTKEFKDHGIGGTIFARIRNTEKLLDFSKIYVKFEGGNPTGTMKDRASYATLKNANDLGFKVVSFASCGNFGASMVHLSKIFDIEAHVYIPESYHAPRIQEMEKQGGIIHRAPGTYEDLVELSSKEAGENGWYNGNPGTEENSKVSLLAYETIAYEIVDNLDYAPDAVSVSVSNGTCFAGIHQGFKRVMNRGETDKVPVMVAASTPGGNPIIDSFKKGRKKIKDLKPEEITETEHNEPIVNWKSLDGQKALDVLWDSRGYATYVTDELMIAFSQLLKKEEGLCVLPASAASLAGLAEFAKTAATPKMSTFVAVLTSRMY